MYGEGILDEKHSAEVRQGKFLFVVMVTSSVVRGKKDEKKTLEWWLDEDPAPTPPPPPPPFFLLLLLLLTVGTCRLCRKRLAMSRDAEGRGRGQQPQVWCAVLAAWIVGASQIRGESLKREAAASRLRCVGLST